MTLLSSTWFFLSVISSCNAGVPSSPLYFHEQVVDHLNPDSRFHEKRWTQRYYKLADEFRGPGSPILVILGGEGGIPPSVGLMYPFVAKTLASAFGAFVLEPEHRFYGESQPLAGLSLDLDHRVDLLTPIQALHDYIKLIDYVREELGCSKDRTSEQYCPVITVGGSYPGFLSAMARIAFPEVVDMAYAGSAPMKFYSQEVHAGDYYDHITAVAEKTLPGCAKAVKDTLLAVEAILLERDILEEELGICKGTIPSYITDRTIMAQEVFMMVGYSFANDNMANYPPSDQTRLYKACTAFSDESITSPMERLKSFFLSHLARSGESCFDMKLQLPAGPKPTISGGDWSGDGTGINGESWDFQTCTLCVEKISFSEKSMFPPREWTMDWLKDHCQARFDVTPQPYRLVEDFHYNDLAAYNVTRILFTNGLNDGWSVGGVKTNLSDSLLALNFPNGAHHSDLGGAEPSDKDTVDLRQGFVAIQSILSKWIDEVKGEAVSVALA